MSIKQIMPAAAVQEPFCSESPGCVPALLCCCCSPSQSPSPFFNPAAFLVGSSTCLGLHATLAGTGNSSAGRLFCRQLELLPRAQLPSSFPARMCSGPLCSSAGQQCRLGCLAGGNLTGQEIGNILWRCREWEAGWICGLAPSALQGWERLTDALFLAKANRKPPGKLPHPAVLVATKQEVPQSLAGAYGALPCPGCPHTAGGGWGAHLLVPAGTGCQESSLHLDRRGPPQQPAKLSTGRGPGEGRQWPPAAPAQQPGLSPPLQAQTQEHKHVTSCSVS